MRLIDELRQSNESTAGLASDYLEHRRQTTRLVLDAAGPTATDSSSAAASPSGRACLLGAGNCLDLDLPALAQRFAEVHLVDIDALALRAAVQAQPREVRARLVIHAPVDLSGLLDKLERWKRFEVTESELLEHHRRTALSLAQKLGKFDVVLSGSFITQMQLSVLNGMGEQHQLFDAVRHVLAVTHLHSLYELTSPGGKALLVTDAVSNQSYPELDQLPSDANPLQVLKEAIAAERLFYIARPGLYHFLQRQDPLLARNTTLSAPNAAWLWQNGPGLRFLVYGMTLTRKA